MDIHLDEIGVVRIYILAKQIVGLELFYKVIIMFTGELG